MKYYKIFQYAYIVFAILFIYDGISRLGDGTYRSLIAFGLAGLAIFMFFFRRRFIKKYENKDK